MKIKALVQARMGSKRCPGKCMATIQGKPSIEIVLNRLKKAKQISEIILITSNLKRDLILKNFAKKNNYKFFCGSENDLIKRFLGAQQKYCKNDKYFLRVTSDNIFIDWKEVDKIINFGLRHKVDFCSHVNSFIAKRNNDFSGEFIKIDALKKVDKLTHSPFDREHVYPFFFNNKQMFKVKRLEVSNSLKSSIKFDLDYKKDLKFFKSIGKKIDKNLFHYPTHKIIKFSEGIKNV